jgi:hypothetical protein
MKRCVIFFAALFVASVTVRADGPALATSLIESNVLCIRASRVTENFAEQLRAIQPATRTMGTILDLRFADGDSGAEAVVKLFSAKKSPLVILVNGQTRGTAAEAAAKLRAANEGIIIGSTNGPGKISADITVTVSADDEREFQENPFASPPTNNATSLSRTNDLLPFIDHMSEAELVRKRIKDGEDDMEIPTPRTGPSQPIIRDPALARAMDLLKALTIFHKTHG